MYEWIKALHVIAVIAWMAGMLYLPRLFVYHCEAEAGSKQSETFKVMERRLLKAIINPAMIVTWLAGLYLAWSRPLVFGGLAAWQTAAGADPVGRPRLFSRCVKDFAADRNMQKSEILPYYQRGTDGPDDRDRHPGSGEAVLDQAVASAVRSARACLRKADRFSILVKSHPTQADVVAFRSPR